MLATWVLAVLSVTLNLTETRTFKTAMGQPSFVPCCAILEDVENLGFCCIKIEDAGLRKALDEINGADRVAAFMVEIAIKEAIVEAYVPNTRSSG